MMTVSLLTALSLQASPPVIDTRYEPSVAYPFGQPNPDAPGELSQFAFFVGAFDCLDERTLPDGRHVQFPAVWNGHYFMNGHAIQDQYWAPGFYTSNIRQYDEAENAWNVSFFSEPRYSTGIWTGGLSGDDMVLTREIALPDGSIRVSRLRFSEISDEGFYWTGAFVDENGDDQVNWSSRCVRRD